MDGLLSGILLPVYFMAFVLTRLCFLLFKVASFSFRAPFDLVVLALLSPLTLIGITDPTVNMPLRAALYGLPGLVLLWTIDFLDTRPRRY